MEKNKKRQTNTNRKFRNKMKKEKGITLIALVVTIIVLLILAGIAINLTVGNNGIFSRAKNAVNTWNEATQNETKAFTEFEQIYDEYAGTAPKRTADYADLNGDGIADGVIYADLTKGKTGAWDGIDVEQYVKILVQQGYDEAEAREEAETTKEEAKKNQTYTIPTVTSGLKEYEIVKTDYTGPFGTGKLIKEKEGTEGADRYYIMALEDVNLALDLYISGLGMNKTFKGGYWYKNAYGKMDDYETFTSEAFGEGKNNTKKIVARWRANGTVEGSSANYGEGVAEDIWGQIGAPTNVDDIVWFVPSKAEWSAFAGELGITNVNYYNDFGLALAYWSSSQSRNNGAWAAGFYSGCLNDFSTNGNDPVRLSATF